MSIDKHILIAGGAGFIGSHLCDRLLGEGHRVVCLDNFSSASEDNVAQLLNKEGFTLIRGDVTEALDLNLDVDVDEIYVLACPASPIHYQRIPTETAQSIVVGASNLLELARSSGARILLASTSEVYGDPGVHPQPEGYWGWVNPVGPRSCYNESKRCAEALFFAMHRQHGVSIKIARVFNTYGPRMQFHDGRVVSSFVLSALRGEPLRIHGDGLQTRSFCYVDDLVDGLVRLMESPRTLLGPVNLGMPEEISIMGLAERILTMTGSRSPIQFAPRPEDDPHRRCPDIHLARTALGWEPHTSLDEGLRLVIAHFEQLLGARCGSASTG